MNLYDNKEDLKTIIVNASEYFSYVAAIIEKVIHLVYRVKLVSL